MRTSTTPPRHTIRRWPRIVALAAVVALAGCTSDSTSTTTADTTGTTGETSSTAVTTPPSDTASVTSGNTATTVEATLPGESLPDESLPPPTEPVPPNAFAATTDATAEIHELLGTPGPVVETASELTTAVADLLLSASPDCEVDPKVGSTTASGEPAIGTIVVTFGCDDSTGGTRYVLTMEGDDTTGWGVASATRASLCLRGVSVTDETLCV